VEKKISINPRIRKKNGRDSLDTVIGFPVIRISMTKTGINISWG
jgi:hypothetical protein